MDVVSERALTATWLRTMEPMVKRAFRIRFVVVGVWVALGALLAVVDPTPWKLLLALAATLSTGAVFAWRIRQFSGRPLDFRVMEVDMFSVLFAVACFAVATGGPASPLLLLFVGPSFVAGFVPDLHRRFHLRVAAFVAPPLALACVGLSPAWCAALASPFALPIPAGGHVAAVVVPLAVAAMGAVFVTLGRLLRGALLKLMAEGETARTTALDAIAARNHELVSITNVLAHELKNPLASIQGLAQLMARDAAPETRAAERLGVLLRESQRMGTVLDEFRDFSRPLSALALAPAALDVIARDVVELNEGIAAERGVALRVDAQTTVEVSCDAQKLRQALVNLVQNALAATPRGGVVTVSVRREGHVAKVHVRDTGAGLPDAVLAGRSGLGFTTRSDGTGVGLVVVRSIATQHGGALRLANHPEGGAEVVFELPVEVRP